MRYASRCARASCGTSCDPAPFRGPTFQEIPSSSRRSSPSCPRGRIRAPSTSATRPTDPVCRLSIPYVVCFDLMCRFIKPESVIGGSGYVIRHTGSEDPVGTHFKRCEPKSKTAHRESSGRGGDGDRCTMLVHTIIGIIRISWHGIREPCSCGTGWCPPVRGRDPARRMPGRG